MRAWKDDLIFRDEVAKEPAITALLSPEKLADTFDYTRQLGNVDAIFERVLGDSAGMNQIPDSAAERVLGTIQEVIDSADEELERAEQWMQALVEEFPDASIVHSYSSWVLSRSGKHREAIEHGRVAVKLSPEWRCRPSCFSACCGARSEHQQAFDEMKRLEKYGHSEEYAQLMQEWTEGKPADGAAEQN